MGTGDIGTVPRRPQGNTDRTTRGKMKKRKKTVSSVSQSASIIQAHIKKLMCMYCIKLCRELQREEKKQNTTFLKEKCLR